MVFHSKTRMHWPTTFQKRSFFRHRGFVTNQYGVHLKDLDEVFLSIKEKIQKVILFLSYSLRKTKESIFPHLDHVIELEYELSNIVIINHNSCSFFMQSFFKIIPIMNEKMIKEE